MYAQAIGAGLTALAIAGTGVVVAPAAYAAPPKKGSPVTVVSDIPKGCKATIGTPVRQDADTGTLTATLDCRAADYENTVAGGLDLVLRPQRCLHPKPNRDGTPDVRPLSSKCRLFVNISGSSTQVFSKDWKVLTETFEFGVPFGPYDYTGSAVPIVKVQTPDGPRRVSGKPRKAPVVVLRGTNVRYILPGMRLD